MKSHELLSLESPPRRSVSRLCFADPMSLNFFLFNTTRTSTARFLNSLVLKISRTFLFREFLSTAFFEIFFDTLIPNLVCFLIEELGLKKNKKRPLETKRGFSLRFRKSSLLSSLNSFENELFNRYLVPVVTVRRFLPFFLLALITFFPPGVLILERNPCFFKRLTFFGCHVLLLICRSYVVLHIINNIKVGICIK